MTYDSSGRQCCVKIEWKALCKHPWSFVIRCHRVKAFSPDSFSNFLSCLWSAVEITEKINCCRIIKSNLFPLIDSFIIVTCSNSSLPLFLDTENPESSPRRLQSMKHWWLLPQNSLPLPFRQQTSKTNRVVLRSISSITVRWSPDLKCYNDSLTIKNQSRKSGGGGGPEGTSVAWHESYNICNFSFAIETATEWFTLMKHKTLFELLMVSVSPVTSLTLCAALG